MRISTTWSHQLSVNAMQNQQRNFSQTQLQLSSGQKLLTPADDPVVASKRLSFKEDINQTNQHQRNIETVRERNTLQESTLANAENLLFRARELTIQAANSTVNKDDRLIIKSEIDQLLNNMVSLANTQNANGDYIFSGFLSKQQPFAWDDNLKAYEYTGANEQRTLQVNQNQRIADGETGLNVFENINSVSQEAAVHNGKRSIFNTLKAYSNALANTFTTPQATIKGNGFINTPINISGSFDLTSDTGTANVNLGGGPYNSIDELVTEINTTGGLNTAGIEAQSNGNYLQFVSTTTGITSTIAINNITGTFGTITGFTDGDNGTSINLATNQSNDMFLTVTDETLTDIDNALTSFSKARSATGARLTTLETQKFENEKYIIDTTTALSNIEDLDYTEAISRFNLQEIALQAAQQSFTRVQSLSLFNFL